MAVTNRATAIVYTEYPSSPGSFEDVKLYQSIDVAASDALGQADALVKFKATQTGGKSITIRNIATVDVGV